VPFRAPEPPGSFLRAGLHLAGLSAFAVAQPLFDLLSRNAEFFAVRGSTRWEIVVFALGVALVPPLVLVALEALAGLIDRRAATGLHLVFVAGLSGLFVLQAVRSAEASTAALLAGSAVAGAGVALLYAKARPARMLLTVLGAAPALFVALFLLASPVQRLVFAATPEPRLANVAARSPVVMVVFDELPTISLMDRAGAIDAVRYPNIARLARDATWYRNATTVHEWTTAAVPAILTGRRPREGSLPLYLDHPENVFTLLGGRYRMRVFEPQTHLCPPELCASRAKPFVARVGSLLSDLSVVSGHLVLPEDLATRLPSITGAWQDFGAADEPRALFEAGPSGQGGRPAAYTARDLEVERFVRALRPQEQPSLSFLHVLLPHHPWEYLPDGRVYASNLPTQPGMVGERWVGDPYFAEQAYQRHLLQVGYVDTVVGRILDRLEEIGAYDESLVVVVADHGLAFQPGDERRRVHAGNLAEIAFVPLFVKAPGQREGRVEDVHVATIDLLPTMAELLGIRMPWPTDGASVAHATGIGRPQVVVQKSNGETVTARLEDALAQRGRALARQVELFGDRARPPGLYALGPHPELVGRDVEALDTEPAGDESFDQYGSTRYDPEAPVVPTRVAGELEGVSDGEDVAVAVNGRIGVVTTTFSYQGATLVSALLPVSAFRPGANDVRLYVVREDGGEVRLRQVAGGR
jgi:Sulfatase